MDLTQIKLISLTEKNRIFASKWNPHLFGYHRDTILLYAATQTMPLQQPVNNGNDHESRVLPWLPPCYCLQTNFP